VKKLAIVEEDSDAREMSAFTFENSGYEVFRCKKETALEDISRIRPHIVVVGDQLGNTSGNELCVKLKNSEQTGLIPVILYSATKTVDEISKGGCADGYVAKPMQLDDFVYLVHRISLS